MTATKLSLYEIDQNTGAETLRDDDVCVTDLFPIAGIEPTEWERETIEATQAELRNCGRAYIGGGAAPLFLLKARTVSA